MHAHAEQITNLSAGKTIRGILPLAAGRRLFDYIVRQEPVLIVHCGQIRAIPLKRAEHQLVDYLEEKQMQAVLDSIDIRSRTGMRDKALLMLMYNNGRINVHLKYRLHIMRNFT